MSYFAHVNNGIVDSVLVINEDTLIQNEGWYCPACGVHRPYEEWVQTSYNVSKGEYLKGATRQERDANKLIGTQKDIAARNRKNYAGVGYEYDAINDIFILPRRHDSWSLNLERGVYEAPKPMPRGEVPLVWDEKLLDWVEVK